MFSLGHFLRSAEKAPEHAGLKNAANTMAAAIGEQPLFADVEAEGKGGRIKLQVDVLLDEHAPASVARARLTRFRRRVLPKDAATHGCRCVRPLLCLMTCALSGALLSTGSEQGGPDVDHAYWRLLDR